MVHRIYGVFVFINNLWEIIIQTLWVCKAHKDMLKEKEELEMIRIKGILYALVVKVILVTLHFILT